MTYENVIIEPVLSEKTNRMREEGKYVFKVNLSATKIQVKEAVRRLFNVHPVSCTMMVVGGKPKRLRYRSGRTSTWKKAIVRLEKGEKISLFEGV
ncbi:MAG: 50S ribosomal protein L23 [Treponemataceae bacterium]|uniref:50S ribosomal protein L23 n=1 Tax=Treponema sp. J25 TaxID=2094121 RepID=UPI0010447307|nr:50S ribosomal protein L23 [Treponema sp. J25]MCX7949698.1 50S ribosomal protein L23 [Treponemataceae bacterium]HOJ99404.1 50S ribosomal protein L23 [Termitinemataceae bacterium]TCW61045.1 50S ribosomal protein L23 [Treponema sp. J25]HOM23026.1 50S ribosomal protein L23 [Termitinemataceae bacterium]HPQ00435.1 50S ribosomal protein L23 [Termitinemataceae bacterium]